MPLKNPAELRLRRLHKRRWDLQTAQRRPGHTAKQAHALTKVLREIDAAEGLPGNN